MTKQVKTFDQELMDITGCSAEDVRKVELLMREKYSTLGDLDRRTFNSAARKAYEVLRFIRIDQSPDSVWLLDYVNRNT